ncbi:MAG: adaptor protein MecA [Clostridia bacterium]|nr:adaptor protein MecA [Clostridia bacterium]
MELIRISSSKLKIMLTPTDMCHFELNNDCIGDDNEKTRRAFRHLMTEIKKQTGFDADDNHISIQYFPSREGGCEMFITHLPALPPATAERINEGTDARAGERGKAPPQRGPSGALAKRGINAFQRDFAYRFDAVEDLLSVCRRLLDLDYIGASQAFRDERKSYYLLLSLLCASPFSLPEELGFINEYGMPENAAMLKLYLKEHGTLLCASNAVSILADL